MDKTQNQWTLKPNTKPAVPMWNKILFLFLKMHVHIDYTHMQIPTFRQGEGWFRILVSFPEEGQTDLADF